MIISGIQQRIKLRQKIQFYKKKNKVLQDQINLLQEELKYYKEDSGKLRIGGK